jgi:hypothetical protein
MTDNELIAGFHGWTHIPTPKGKGKGYWNFPEDRKAQWNSDAFQYHKSWDWLMPVVQKIKEITPEIRIPRDLDSLRDGTHGSEPYFDVVAMPICTPINEIYEAVVKFIKWYNSRNS